MSLTRKLVVACLCASTLNHALAQSHVPQEPLTLESALKLALAENPELLQAASRVEAATARAQQARRWSNPELELNAEEWPVEDNGGFSDAKQTIGLSQTLAFPGKLSLERQIGTRELQQATAEWDGQRRNLMRDVTIAYYEVLAAERRAVVAHELVTVAEASANAVHKRVTAGAAADPEWLRAEVPLEQSRADEAAIALERITARQNLALHLGRPDLADVELNGALAESADLTLLDQAPDSALNAHPTAVSAEAGRERAELEWRRARLEPYPDITVGVAGGRLGDSGQSIVELALSLPLPLFDRGASRKQEAFAMRSGSEAEANASAQRLRHAWTTGGARLRAAAEQVASYRDRILPKAEEALRLVRIGYEQGRFDLMDLLDTQRTAAEARLEYQLKLLELNVAHAELEALLGSRTSDLNATPLP